MQETEISNFTTDNAEEISAFTFNPLFSDAEKRLDAFLADKIEGWSRSRLQKLIDDGEVLVNGQKAKASYKLRGNETIEVELSETTVETFEPENIPLDVVYEDEYLIIINKPAGLVVHPGAGVASGTLANAIAYHLGLRKSDLNFENEPDEKSKLQTLKAKIGIVHRLDKQTSGLIVVAKNESIHEALSKQFRKREVFKSYLALAHGRIETALGKIEAAMGRDPRQRTKMALVKGGREALTLWKVRQRYEKFTLLDVEIKTGRTHQIRVHLASIKRPIVGDETYNAGRDKTVNNPIIRQAIENLHRLLLHAEKLSFTHPVSGEIMKFTAPLPSELREFLELL